MKLYVTTGIHKKIGNLIMEDIEFISSNFSFPEVNYKNMRHTIDNDLIDDSMFIVYLDEKQLPEHIRVILQNRAISDIEEKKRFLIMELSVRYSPEVDAKTRELLVLKDGVIFNNRYEGSAKAGAVKVRKTGAAEVQDYDPATGAKLTKATSEYIPITIDKDKAVNEIIDGYEAAAVPDDMIADRLDDAAYAIALTLDTDGAVALVDGGTAFGDVAAVTADTAYGVAVDARTAMSKAGVPNDGQRYLVVSLDTYAVMLKSPEFIKASDLGDKVVQTGAIGAIAGFNVYESTNLGVGVEFVAGHPLYATRVNEWAVDVHVQDLSQSGTYIGACAVQGRKVYAHKVTNPAAILVKKSA